MTEVKIGLEIHRQIDSNKLFCNCPSILRDDKPGVIFKRNLRTVSSEVGEKDVVAEYEMAKNKYAVYEGYSDSTCLVEYDEEPVHSINQKALDVALQVALMLNCKIPEEIIVMRKQVIDYSNTSGFQRTVLIGRNGYVETPEGKVGINGVYLEEDAARKISEDNEKVTYRLDRLGIPLIEITTAPDIKSSVQAKEVAAHLGMVLKSTGKVKGGIGTVRQDVNISVNNGPRVEIKGFQDLKNMPSVIDKEIQRHLKDKIKSEVRKAETDGSTSYLRPMPGSARMYPETDHSIIVIDQKRLESIKLPELISERILRYRKEYKLNSELAILAAKDDKFEEFVNKFDKLDPSFIAQTLVMTLKDLKTREGLNIEKLKKKDLEEVFGYVGKVGKDAVPGMLADKIRGVKINLRKYKADEKDLVKDVKDIIKKNKGASLNAVMGIVMKKYRGKVDGKEVTSIIKKNLK